MATTNMWFIEIELIQLKDYLNNQNQFQPCPVSLKQFGPVYYRTWQGVIIKQVLSSWIWIYGGNSIVLHHVGMNRNCN